jgi:cell division transport system permease protein
MRWLHQNLQALQQVLTRMRRHFFSTLMMFGVMGVTLCLPGMMYVVVDNLRLLAMNIQDEPQLTLFLKLNAKQEAIDAIEQRLQQHAEIKSYRFESKDHAWQQFQVNAVSADVVGSLEKNPLPDAFFVIPKSVEPSTIEKLQQEMQTWPGVDLAQADASWIKRLDLVLKLGQKAIWVLAALLGFALIAIIGNTIRLQILTQREEIEVSQLIGATKRFIRRPFLYAGVIYGLGGGLAAWGLMLAVVDIFNASVLELAHSYASGFNLTMPHWSVNLMMLGCAVGLGWIGSYVAVGRYLASFQAK